MANLLRWSTGLTFPKKKEENNVLTTSTPLIKSLKTMNPTIANKANSATTTNTNNSFSNSIMRTQQINEQIRQQAEQRRQQEEQQRQQQIAEAQRQQEQRKQQEEARRQQQQQALQQKQNNLLSSAGLGNNNFNASNFRANLEAQKQAKIQKQQQEAEAKKNTWKKYYDEEKQKVREQAFKNNWGESTLQDIFNAGWDSRLAETNARNRYTSELLNQGQTEKAKKAANEASNVARQYSEQERANSRALGASYDSEVKDNPFLATFNAIRRADIGNAMLGGAEGGLADVAKFLINTGQYAIPIAGWSQGILRGAPSVAEALVGRGLDKSTGNYKDLNLLERAGRGISGGIDVVGPKLNASEKLAGGLLNLLKGGTKEVAKQGGKAALMEFAKNALGEGIEEGVQEIGDYFGDSNTLTDENGNISAEKIGQLAGQVGQSAALGALGGGLMSGANILVGKAANNINAKRNANVNENVDTNIDTNVNENLNENIVEKNNVDTSNVQTTQDGTMVKTNVDGTATKLSDTELANVVEQRSAQPSTVKGLNPFIENSVKLNSSEDIATLAKRAEQGDTYAKQRLAELTGQNEEENTDWRGKRVEDVINPEDTKQGVAGRIKDEVQNIKDGAAALGQMLTGQNRLQPAYAGVDGDYARIDDNTRTINDIDTTKSFSTYVGEGNKIAFKIDYPIFDNMSASESSTFLRQVMTDMAKEGTFIDVGDVARLAKISRETSHKAGGAFGWTDEQLRQRNEILADIEEVSPYLHNVRFEEPKANTKDNVIGVIKGDVEVDINGKKIYPEVIFRVYDNGDLVLHDVSRLDRLPSSGSLDSNSDRHDETSGATRQPSDYAPIVSQNNANVKNKSQFAENTSANKNFSTETRSDLKSDPLTYKPTSNEERLTRANEILSTKSFDEIDNYLRENFFNVKPKDTDSADMVLAGEYAKMLDAKGQFDRSTEIINRMSEIGTKQGQNIQALSLMMNRSPEGIANMAQNAIKKGGGEMTPELRRQIVEKTQEIGRTRSERAKLADENAKISEQIMNGKGDLAALRQRQMQIAQSYRLQLDQEGRQFSRLSDIVGKNSPDKRSIFGSIWRAGLLSGPRTHTGNAVSNTFQNVINAGADRFAAGMDWARAKVTGTERQVVASAGGRGKGVKRGLKAAAEVMKTGDNLWDSADMVTGKETAWGQGGEMEFKNKIANTMLAKPTNFTFRAMSAGDLPFRYAAFENAIRTEAKRQGINQGYKGQALQDYINSRVATPDPELQAYGIRKGNEAVYDVDTKLSELMALADKWIDKQDNKYARNALRATKTVLTPFVKVPSKVLSTAIDYSPLGSVKALVNKLGSKTYTTAQFETDLAKSGLGSAGFVGLGYVLSAAGLLTGGYPSDKDERERWRAEGIEPNSIKIGDKYISMNYLGPLGMLTAIGAGVQQRQAKGEDPLTIAQGTLIDTFNSFLNQSYVQGLNNALNAVTDSQRYGESFWNSLARGITPNILRQTATATDPKQRQVNNAGEAIISGIPWLSQNLDAKVDVYGREIENKQTLPLGQMWDALKISNSRETNDVIDEVKRLHDIDPNNKDLQVTPPTQDNSIGTNIKLTDAQKTQLQKDTGEAAITAMRQVMQSEKYASLSDEQKAKALDKARSEAQTQARKQFIEANNITPENNPETKNSGGSVTGNYASKAITGATSTRQNGKLVANDSISQESKSIIDKYNSMDSEDWDKYLYGTTAESAAAEYNLAKAKYENDLANDKLTEPQKIKRQKELAKLEVSQKWTKEYRDAYSLAGTKADMQAYLDGLDAETRAKTVATLNGLNNAMYNAGIISKSTYKTRYNAINNTTSSKSGSRKSKTGISSAEASALASLAKTMANADDNVKVKTPEAPTTKRKMSKTKSSGNKTQLATYTPSGKKSISVSKGAKRSIA